MTRICLLIFSILPLFVDGQFIDPKYVPKNLTLVLDSVFPGTINLVWRTAEESAPGKLNFDASFSTDGIRMWARMDSAGSFLELEQSINVDSIPSSCRAFILEQEKEFKVVDARRIILLTQDLIIITVTWGRGYIYYLFTGNGIFMKKKIISDYPEHFSVVVPVFAGTPNILLTNFSADECLKYNLLSRNPDLTEPRGMEDEALSFSGNTLSVSLQNHLFESKIKFNDEKAIRKSFEKFHKKINLELNALLDKGEKIHDVHMSFENSADTLIINLSGAGTITFKFTFNLPDKSCNYESISFTCRCVSKVVNNLFSDNEFGWKRINPENYLSKYFIQTQMQVEQPETIIYKYLDKGKDEYNQIYRSLN